MAPSEFRLPYQFCVSLLCCSLFLCPSVHAQQQPAPSTDKQPAPENPAQIELLETRYRFEANGDSRKEVHARVKINTELGVRQFARLNFDYNRSFESIDLPLVRITHPGGGTADILPSAITDNPNPAVLNAPAYQDVRVKSVRILGLAPGDLLEYRVITTVSHHPLAPDFWLDHSFDRTGVVSQEIFEIDLPASRATKIQINPRVPVPSTGASDEGRTLYRWSRFPSKESEIPREPSGSEPDVVLTSFADWKQLADRLKSFLEPIGEPAPDVLDKASALARVTNSDPMQTLSIRAEAFYTFVSQKIRTIDLPLGSTGFKTRAPSDILASGYGTAEDKHILFAALANSYFGPARAGLLPAHSFEPQTSLPRPSAFDHLLTMTGWPSINFWLDLNTEVAPYLVIPSEFRRKKALVVGPAVTELWRLVHTGLPFPAVQKVVIDAKLAADGGLTAKVKYSMRGDNELLLRVAFHKAPEEKWKDLAQLLSLSDGFRGKVTSVTASDPYATREPFTLDYEITMPKFVDGLPDPPAKPSPGAAASPIELGTPLEVKTQMTLHLPPGTTTQTPTGTAVQRDYATFTSQYSAKGPAITASRHISFLLRQIPAERAADYNAFLRAVQNDEAQDFTLDRPAAIPNPLSPKPPKTVSPTKQARP